MRYDHSLHWIVILLCRQLTPSCVGILSEYDQSRTYEFMYVPDKALTLTAILGKKRNLMSLPQEGNKGKQWSDQVIVS